MPDAKYQVSHHLCNFDGSIAVLTDAKVMVMCWSDFLAIYALFSGPNDLHLRSSLSMMKIYVDVGAVINFNLVGSFVVTVVV